MKKIIKIVVLLIAIGFIGIQFVRPNRINPAIVESDTLEANVQIPDNIKKTFLRSCDDCHTNRSIYPWYSNIAPLSWKIVEHIEDGRKQLNFSIWKTYDAKRQKKKLNEVCEEVTSGEMPHPQYLYLHRDGILSEADKKEICGWTEAEASKIVIAEK
jgi:Haem-binding domain